MNYYLTWFAVREVAAHRIDPVRWKLALDYLRATGDCDGWALLVRGA